MKSWAGLLVIVACAGAPTIARCQSLSGEMRAHGGPVRALAALPDGQLASAGFDSAIIIWDLSRGQAVHVLQQHATAVNTLVARGDGCLVSGGEDKKIKIWCKANGTAPATTATLSGHDAAVSSLAVTKDGKTLVSGSWDHTVRLWNRQGDARVLAQHAAPVTSVALTADATAVLSASQDGAVQLTFISGTIPSRSLKVDAPVIGLAMTLAGESIVACIDGSLRLIDAQFTGSRELAKLDGPLTSVSLSLDEATIAVSGLRAPVTLVNRLTGAAKRVSAAPGLPVWAVAFSNDGREIFTGGGDRTVRRFDTTTGIANAPSIPTMPEPELSNTKERGARVFRACVACHGVTAADTNLAGPTLHQIMGRRIASLSGYEYSRPLVGMDIVWTAETISKLFELGPTVFTPGTKMPEQRITDPEDRRALVEWLSRVTVP